MQNNIWSRFIYNLTFGYRYVPEFKWEKNNWTYNTFRVFETIFGRKDEIRKETSLNNKGEIICHSLESKVVYTEVAIRKYVEQIAYNYKLSLVTLAGATAVWFLEPTSFFFSVPIVLGAIALDNSTNATSGGTTVFTASFTVSGSNLILVVTTSDQANSSTNTTGVTANSVATTLIDTCGIGTGSFSVKLWGLLAPTTGVITGTRSSAVDNFDLCAASYSGVSQSTAIGSLTKTSLNGGAGNQQTNFTLTLTAGTNSWTAMGSYISAANKGTAGTGTTQRQAAGNIGKLWDSNGAVSGSTSLNVNTDASYFTGAVMISFDPVGGASPTVRGFFTGYIAQQ